MGGAGSDSVTSDEEPADMYQKKERSNSKQQLDVQASTIAGELQRENQDLANEVRSLKS